MMMVKLGPAWINLEKTRLIHIKENAIRDPAAAAAQLVIVFDNNDSRQMSFESAEEATQVMDAAMSVISSGARP